MTGDVVWAWQAQDTPGGAWSVIATMLPGLGAVTLLLHRDRRIADGFRHIALEHGRQAGMAVRFVRLEVAEVEWERDRPAA